MTRFSFIVQIFLSVLIVSPSSGGRRAKTLTGSFPFGAQQHHGHHGHHGEHHEHHGERHETQFDFGETLFLEDLPRFSRQGAEEGEVVDEGFPDINAIAQAGERCVEKVMMTEETVYDNVIECHHSYDEKCHTTYKTIYDPQQMEMCEEVFEKLCYIEYKKKAEDETVEVCNDFLSRDCEEEGPIVCEQVSETECLTNYHEHEVEEDEPNCRIMMIEKCQDVTLGYSTEKKCDKWPKTVCELETVTRKRYTPETKCTKKPRQICGPEQCPLTKKETVCRNETETVIHEVPEEECSLNPKKNCNFITKMIPKLIPDLECVDVPKEVCVRVRKNPRVIKKPTIKKWCYTPTSTEDTGSGFEVTTESVPLEGTELDQTDTDDTVPDSVPDTDETAPGPDGTEEA